MGYEAGEVVGPQAMPSLVGAVKGFGLYPMCKQARGIKEENAPWLSLAECAEKGQSR